MLDLDQSVAGNEILYRDLRWEIHPWLHEVEIANLLIKVEELPLLMDSMVVLIHNFLKPQHHISQLFYNEFAASKLWTADNNALDCEHYFNLEMIEESIIMLKYIVIIFFF